MGKAERVSFTLKLVPENAERIDKIAKRMTLSRTAAINWLIADYAMRNGIDGAAAAPSADSTDCGGAATSAGADVEAVEGDQAAGGKPGGGRKRRG